MALNLENAIPLRWPSGPLEIARRQKTGSLTQEARATLERWHQSRGARPAKGLGGGLPGVDLGRRPAGADSEQQNSAVPLIEAARKAGLAVVGWVEGSGDAAATVISAQSGGIAPAVAIHGFKGKVEIPVIPWGDRTDGLGDRRRRCCLSPATCGPE